MEDSSQNLADYLIQRTGGPPYYSERKAAFPSLIEKHQMVEMSERTAELWLKYMKESLDEVIIIILYSNKVLANNNNNNNNNSNKVIC